MKNAPEGASLIRSFYYLDSSLTIISHILKNGNKKRGPLKSLYMKERENRRRGVFLPVMKTLARRLVDSPCYFSRFFSLAS
jgi:hypothetical protein